MARDQAGVSARLFGPSVNAVPQTILVRMWVARRSASPASPDPTRGLASATRLVPLRGWSALSRWPRAPLAHVDFGPVVRDGLGLAQHFPGHGRILAGSDQEEA
jgi:hypothetical protein